MEPKKRSIIKKVDVPLYSCSVTIILTDDIRGEINRLNKKHKDREEYTLEGEAEGVCLSYFIDSYYLIFSNRHLSHNVLAHELTHATIQITRHRDIKDDESSCYIAGYLAEVIYKLLKSKNIEVTK